LPVVGIVTLMGALGFVALVQIQAHQKAEHSVSAAQAARSARLSAEADLAALVTPSGFVRVNQADGCRASRASLCLSSDLSSAAAAQAIEALLGATRSSVTSLDGLPGAEPSLRFAGRIGSTPVAVMVDSHQRVAGTATTPAVYAGSTVDIDLAST
jgi:hypothetical protein